MCWNKYVSLNTFLFSSFVLGLFIYNNEYTPYKLFSLENNVFLYLFFASVILMQLNEHFLWKAINTKNENNNHIFSVIGILILFSQPIFSLLLIQSNQWLRNLLVSIYISGGLITMYFMNIQKAYTSVSNYHHLVWNWDKFENPDIRQYLIFVWMFMLFFSLAYNGWYFAIFFGLGLYSFSIYNYLKDGSIGSNWCWLINSFFLLIAIKLLFLLPSCDK